MAPAVAESSEVLWANAAQRACSQDCPNDARHVVCETAFVHIDDQRQFLIFINGTIHPTEKCHSLCKKQL